MAALAIGHSPHASGHEASHRTQLRRVRTPAQRRAPKTDRPSIHLWGSRGKTCGGTGDPGGQP